MSDLFAPLLVITPTKARPDLSIFEFKDLSEVGGVKSIESYLFDSIPKRLADTVFTFGYNPDSMDKIDPNFQGFKMKSTPDSNFTIDYVGVRAKVTNSYFVTPKSTIGMSGSPIFLKYGDRIYFGGVITTESPKTNSEIIVKPQELLRLLKAY
ncbi:MAG: hypothetical protein JWR50_642 [Mucilaginibacter sp.]|nr:hypothetical protein [Mucilaginibacter sp.]